MAQSVKRPTLDFHSGHDLMVGEFKALMGLGADSLEPAWDSLLPSLSAPPLRTRTLFFSLSQINKLKKKKRFPVRGAWVAQSVKCLTSAQAMISRLMSLTPVLGSGLTAQSLKPASDSVILCLCLSLPLPRSLLGTLFLSKINKH